ncbi:hypothetical protein AQUCO_00201158v1 [Aquilegia coerulea]|uniref:Uncharacterized protein n=1 Tax=Aquilegia coerulea TaxID=218851 RepID=A0A2G5F6J7_AQUCA|nr:hypothetical protein AQUCO_00201158v1 [Aquilegia coerulea]
MALAAEKKWLFTLFSAAFLTLILFLSAISTFSSFNGFQATPDFTSSVQYGPHYPPSFAYYISGGKGQKDQIFRLLLAVYHPRNRYLLHLGSDATNEERSRLALAVRAVPAIRAFGNVDVVGKPDPATYMGSSNIAATLHAAAILLKVDHSWDWFITLSALDYPLLTQDDLSHAFSSVRRDLNFIDHTSNLGWKEDQRVQPIVVDPGIYLARQRNQIFHATQKRPTPEAFKFFTGFQNMTVNSDLRYMVWDNPPKMEPRYLNVSDYEKMVQSGAAFARQFHKDESVLSAIDKKILKRSSNRATRGAWCTGQSNFWMDPCSKWGDVNIVKAGPQAKRFKESMTDLLDDYNSEACK